MKHLLLLILLFCSLLCRANKYYFSLSGSDNNSSTQAQSQNTPWKSISRLNDIANNSYSGVAALTVADTLFLKMGDVFYGSFNFTKSNINISVYGTGNRPVVTSLQQLPGLTLSGTNRYKSSVINSESDPKYMLVDGVLAEMGRFPNANLGANGWLFSSGVTSSTETIGTVKYSYANLPYSNWTGLSKPWNITDWTGSEIVVRFNRFICNTYTLDNADNSGKQTFSGTNNANTNFRVPKGSSLETTEGFFLRNNLATLDSHTEWYYSSDSNLAYIYLTFSPSGHKIEMPTIDNAVTTTNASNVYISDIEFNGYNNQGVYATTGNTLILNRCRINNVRTGITNSGTNNLRFLNSTMNNVLRYGLYKNNVGGSNVYLEHDTITNIMPFLGSNVGYGGDAVYLKGNGDTVLHCLIRNTGYNGITFEYRCTNILIAYNVIDSFGQKLDDGGAIYTVNPFPAPTFTSFNRIVKQNIILNSANSGYPFVGTTGIPNSDIYRAPLYGDELTANVVWDGNIVVGSYTKGIYFNDGLNNEIKNNIFYNYKTYGYEHYNKHDSIPDPSRPGKNKLLVLSGNNIHNNTFYSDGTGSRAIHINNRQSVNIANYGKIDTNYFAFPLNKNQLFRTDNASGSSTYLLPEWQTNYGLDKNSKLSPLYFSTTSPPTIPSILVYNDHENDSVVSLQGKTWINPKGVKFNNNSLTLKPFTAEVLIYTGIYTSSTTSPPSVNLTSPADGTTFKKPVSITISANATDQDGTITKVEFYNGNTLLGTDLTSPYNYTWSNVDTGSYTITAKAYDNTSLTTSSTVDIMVTATALPLINITLPTGNPTYYYPESININVNARTLDPGDSVYRVDYYNGSTRLHSETNYPFSWTWENVQPGNYTITAIAVSGVTNLSSQPAMQNITVLPTPVQTTQKFRKFKFSRIK